MREAPYVVRRRFARPHPAPVIVLGNQKSGTTVIAALLAESAGCAVTLDIFFRFRRPVLARLLTGRDSLDRFIRRHPYWFSHPIIKEPSLTFFHDDLRRLFPSARFVFIVRDPRDNIRSILNRLRLPGNLPDLPPQALNALPANRGWRLILEGTLFGTRGDTYIDVLAQRWNRTADVAWQHCDTLTLIRYEDFLKDKAGTIERLARTVALEPLHDVTDKVDVQYQPRGDRDVSWIDFFGKENLRRIELLCAARMRRFDYPPSLEPVSPTVRTESPA